MLNKLKYLLIFLLLAVPALAFWPFTSMDYKEETIYSGQKVYLDEPWARIEVSPHTAFSLPSVRNFTQGIEVCNNDDSNQYLFLDYYFDRPVEYSSITRIRDWTETKTIEVQKIECQSTGFFPNNQTICSENGVEQKTQVLSGTEKTPLTPKVMQKEWGDVAHYIVSQGELVQANTCQKYTLNYRPNKIDANGKWNMRVWGNTQDDWTCIEKENCLFDYHLDPTFSTNFSYKANINITNPGASINNYTIFVNFTNNTFNFSNFQADFDDVIFTNFDETAQLGCYLEAANTTHANFSVLISNFSNVSATSIWMYYGNATMDKGCAEINNAYLLADDMNSTSINTSIWNQYVSTLMLAGGSTKGYYELNTTAGQFCQQWSGSTYNTQDCISFANTSGVLKSSQSFRMDADIRTTTPVNGCGQGWGMGNATGTYNRTNFGTVNMSWTSDDFLQQRVKEANVDIASATFTGRDNTLRNYSFRSYASGFQPIGEWYNNSVTGGPLTRFLSGAKSSNSYLNNSAIMGFGMQDGSGGVACNLQFYGLRIRADNNATPTFTFGQAISIVAYSNFTINDSTSDSTTYETGLTNFSVNVTLDQNRYNNISAANFSYNGIILRENLISNYTIGNVTHLNITIRPDLVTNNASSRSFNWSVTAQGNGSNETKGTSNGSQTVLWAYYPNQVNATANITETQTVKLNYSVRWEVTNSSASITPILDYNLTNSTGLVLQNSTNIIFYQNNVSVGFLSSAYQTNVTVNVTPFINITFNGTTLSRNRTAVTTIEQVNKMILHDCVTTAAFGTGNATNYFIRDIDTLALVTTADLTADYDVWNNTEALNRTYLINYLNNATPSTCMMPSFASLNTSAALTYGGDGYLTTSNFLNDLSIFVGTTNITLFLTNSTGATNVTMTVVDENDDAIENATISIERYNTSNGNFTLVASDRTDFQGQKRFGLNLNFQYRINISDTNGHLYTLINLNPASVGPFEILTTTLTFRVLLGQGTSLEGLIESLGLVHNLTFTNSTGNFNLQVYDPSNVSSNICLEVWHFNTTNRTRLANNCSSSDWSSLDYDIGTMNGSFQAVARSTSTRDGLSYIFDTLDVYVPEQLPFGEDSIWVIFIIGSLAALGLYLSGGNPSGLIAGAVLGLGVSKILVLISLSWTGFVGIGVVAGLAIYVMER